jgi:hypothetical protein
MAEPDSIPDDSYVFTAKRRKGISKDLNPDSFWILIYYKNLSAGQICLSILTDAVSPEWSCTFMNSVVLIVVEFLQF